MQERILFIGTEEIQMLDIPLALDSMGYKTIYEELDCSVKYYDINKFKEVDYMIKKHIPSKVFSCDFNRSIAESCFKNCIQYISWIYDCPQEELYSEQALYPTNHIFVFDKKQEQRLKSIGIQNVYHIPLAIYPDRINVALSQIKNYDKYYYDVMFIGQLYYIHDNEQLLACLDDASKSEWIRIVHNSFLKWEKNQSIFGTMPNAFVTFFDKINRGKNVEGIPYISAQYEYESSVLSRYIAYRERKTILNSLAKKHNVCLYTNDKKVDELSNNITVLPGISYYGYDIFKIYNRSKININISLHCIETGLSQRIFDVMASGGFMITNYQEEIEDLFEIGEDIIVYHNLEELCSSVDYYLQHDLERERIAQNGQRKVMNYHNYQERFKKVMDIVEKRLKSYDINSDLYNTIKKISQFSKEEKIGFLERVALDNNAVNIYQFGRLWNDDDTEINLYLASYYLDKCQIKNARDTLKRISNPSKDIQQLISEIEGALAI